MQARTNPLIRFGVFEFDLKARELRKRGVRLKLQQQPFQVLAMLLERPGEAVTREQLRSELWSDDTYVLFDKNLSTAVQKIRQALGDSSTSPQYVETIPRVGYRFIAPVDPCETSAVPETPGHFRSKVAWGVAGLTALLLLGASLAWQPRLTPPARDFPQETPLTAYPGQEIDPAFSPDGSQVAFAWNGAEDGDFDLYLRTLGPGDPVRLTEDPKDDTDPAWSPDGRFIAFIRRELTWRSARCHAHSRARWT